MNNLVICQAEAADIEEILDCLGSSALHDTYFTDKDKSRQIITTGIAHHDSLVAVLDGRCAGYISVMPNGMFGSLPYCHILSVRAELRGNGIGSALLNAAEEKFVDAGKSKIFLEVDDFNPDARRLYVRRGYKLVGPIEGLYKPGITSFLMVKDLTTNGATTHS